MDSKENTGLKYVSITAKEKKAKLNYTLAKITSEVDRNSGAYGALIQWQLNRIQQLNIICEASLPVAARPNVAFYQRDDVNFRNNLQPPEVNRQGTLIMDSFNRNKNFFKKAILNQLSIESLEIALNNFNIAIPEAGTPPPLDFDNPII